VPFRVAGWRFRFEPGTEPFYLELVDHPVQSLNREQLDAFRDVIHCGDTVLDVGANVGLYALVAARAVGPGGRVFAFEPAPAAAALLAKNLRRNALQARVSIAHCAAGAEAGVLRLYVAGASSENSAVSARVHTAANRPCEELEVPVVTLDTFCREHDLHPQVVKIDVEGWELAVLRGMPELLASELTILCEMHPHLWADPAAEEASIEALCRSTGRRLRQLNGRDDRPLRYGPYWLTRTP
jgi:FkbM family methyltransferase